MDHTHPQRDEQARRLDEAVTDVAEIRRALNTMYRKIHQKLVKFRTLEGVERQLDYILVNRKYLTHSGDAEANDMIHMGSDHRSVVAPIRASCIQTERLPKKKALHGREQHGSSRRIWEA